MSTATMSYRTALDATDAAACLSRTLRDVLRAVVAVSMGPRALRGRAVAYSVLGYMARCSRSTVERAVAQLERLGLVRRGRTVDDARGGWGYEWHVDEAQLVALAPRDSYGEHAARQRARRATARPDGGCVDAHPYVKLTYTEPSSEPSYLHPPTPRGLDSDPLGEPPSVDPLDDLDEPPRAALWADEPAPAPIGRGWASRAVAGAADAARALVAGLRAGPARATSSSSPSPSPDGGGDGKGKVNTDKAAPLVERIVAAHRGEHRAEVEALIAQHGEAQLAAAWAYGEQHARLQPPRPAYLRAWLTNTTNAPSSSTSRPSSSPPAGPYSAAHEAFAPKEKTPEPTDEQRARNLAALDALDALLV